MPHATAFLPLLLGAVLSLWLTGCDNSNETSTGETGQPASMESSDDDTPSPARPDEGETRTAPAKLRHHTETLERRPEGCESDDCPVFEAHLQVYEDQPALNEAVRQRLAAQLVVTSESPATPDSLEAAAEQFLATAAGVADDRARGWELSGDTKQVGRWRDLITIAINSYEFTGGAHGMPVSQWLNWDLARNQAVPLGQLLQPGREAAFWDAAEQAHARWLEKEVKSDDDFRKDWPFQQTDSYRLTRDGLVLHYDVYSIAPYAMGQPELTVPWRDLEDVVRPRYRRQ